MYKPHHGPLDNSWVLISFLAIIIAVSIWKLSPSWGFLLVLFGVIVFFSSYISAVRAPLMSDEEIELAIHEKYHGRRYPDTDLHDGHLPKHKKYVHSRHKKKLVELHLEEQAAKRNAAKRKSTSKKSSAKKVASKKSSAKRPAKKAAKRAAPRKASKKRVGRPKKSSKR